MIRFFRRHEYEISKKKIFKGFRNSRGVHLLCKKCGSSCFVARATEDNINIESFNDRGCKGKESTKEELKLIVVFNIT